MRATLKLWILLAQASAVAAEPKVGPFLEPQTPFLQSALTLGKGREQAVVRRGVLLRLPDDHWACFDTDLLRLAAVWKAPKNAEPFTMDSMAAISYPEGKTKASRAPKMIGKPLLLSPPAFSKGNDPRIKLLSHRQDGVGPLPPERGRWHGIALRGKIPTLNYRLADAEITEVISLADGIIRRSLEVAPHTEALQLDLGPGFTHLGGSGATVNEGLLYVPPSKKSIRLTCATAPCTSIQIPPHQPATPVFPEALSLINGEPLTHGAYRSRVLTMPTAPRFVRPTDIDFLSDGTGILTTLDGDVWRIENPEEKTSRWIRIASGLYETISLAITPDDRIFTLGRDQITELIDRNCDGQVDLFRNASNAFQQTLHTRDYATSLEIGPDGSFYLAKGGIYSPTSKQDNELSSHRGAILKITPDGNTTTVLADGLRLPYVGLRKDHSVFASDQQGHYVPSTPVHLIGKSQPNLGFAATNHRRAPLTEPLLWYPYQANRSAAAFSTWRDQFLQISWSGRLFAIVTPEAGQAFSWQLPLQLDFPSLNATRHPLSGKLYVTGLGISGYKPTTPHLSGLVSLEESFPFPKPTRFETRADQVEVTFDRPLSEDETILPASPALRLFNIKRTEKYGSGHFRWDDQPGEHRFQPSSFRLSEDRRTLTLRFDQLARSEVLDLHLTLSTKQLSLPLHLYSRPVHLPKADLQRLARQQLPKPTLKPGSPKRGHTIFITYACAGCHSLDDPSLVGPTLQGIGSRRSDAYLRESILQPSKVIVEGYEAAMPSFAGVLTDQQLADLLAYLSTLK